MKRHKRVEANDDWGSVEIGYDNEICNCFACRKRREQEQDVFDY